MFDVESPHVQIQDVKEPVLVSEKVTLAGIIPQYGLDTENDEVIFEGEDDTFTQFVDDDIPNRFWIVRLINHVPVVKVCDGDADVLNVNAVLFPFV